MKLPPDIEARVMAAAQDVTSPLLPTTGPGRKGRAAALAQPAWALEVVVPILTTGGNTRDAHWSARHKRARGQYQAVEAALWPFVMAPAFMIGPWVVTLTRTGGRGLDDDGLRTALKHVRDAVACWLVGGDYGQRDNDERVVWEYAERRGGLRGVVVRIETRLA